VRAAPVELRDLARLEKGLWRPSPIRYHARPCPQGGALFDDGNALKFLELLLESER
jgi:hypothetical protein